MNNLLICIPKSLAFQRLAKLASAAARQIDNGVALNDAHVFALLEYFEFLAPEQFALVMGAGLAAEFSAVTEHEFPLSLLNERAPLLRLLLDHTAMFAGAFCRDGEEQPRCYRSWLRVRQEGFPNVHFSGYDCLVANIAMAVTLGGSPPLADSKVQFLKYRILKRTAEVLLAVGYNADEHLRQICPEQGLDPTQLLALQAFVLSNGIPDDLPQVCSKISGSLQATFLYWASKDVLVRYLLEAWQWLKPIRYDDSSALNPGLLQERGGLLYKRWKDGLGAPAGLARRELPTNGAEGEVRFPCVLQDGQRQRFSPVPLMLVGGPGVGKTAFLGALTRSLSRGGGLLREGPPSEWTEPTNSTGEQGESEKRASAAQPGGSSLLVHDDQDPQASRWMRLTIIDHDGQDIAKPELPREFLKKLRAAKGLLFLVDDRYFRNRVSRDPDSNEKVPVQQWPKDAVDLAAWYSRILQTFLDVNHDALHLPIALVVNKADLLLGGGNLRALDHPFLIAEEIKMELVHAGLQYPGESDDPFGRLRYCIHNTPNNSKDLNNQKFIFDFVERFRGFIAAALGQTFRFQIFLTSSVAPNGEDGEHVPHGVWEATRWIVNQLRPAYRVQAKCQLEQDRAESEQLKKDIEEALLRDREAYADFENACSQKEKRINALVHLAILDSVLGRDQVSTGRRIDSAKERMRIALEEAFSLAELEPLADAVDPAPFTTRRRMAQKALGRLEKQIAYLTEWHDLLCDITPQPAALPATRNKAALATSVPFRNVGQANAGSFRSFCARIFVRPHLWNRFPN
jgi:hypothetical protein